MSSKKNKPISASSHKEDDKDSMVDKESSSEEESNETEDDSGSDSSYKVDFEHGDDYYYWDWENPDGYKLKKRIEKERGDAFFFVDLLFPFSPNSCGALGMLLDPSGTKIVDVMNNKFSPFVDLKLQSELSRMKFATLYFEISNLNTYKLLSVYLTFFHSGRNTRLVDLKRFPNNYTDSDVATAIKDVVEHGNFGDKIVSIIGENDNVKKQLATDLGKLYLFNFEGDFTKLLCELFEDALKKTSPVDFTELMRALRGYFGKRQNRQKIEKKCILFAHFDDKRFHKNADYLDIIDPIFPEELEECFVANHAGLWYRLERRTFQDMKEYFSAEEDDQNDENLAKLKQFFSDPASTLYFHLAYKASSHYYTAISIVQGPRSELIVEHLDSLLFIKGNVGCLLEETISSYYLDKLSPETQTQFQSNIKEFYRILLQGIEQHFGELIERFEPLNWITLDKIPEVDAVLSSLTSLPESIIGQINREHLREEVTLVREYISIETKVKKEMLPRNLIWKCCVPFTTFGKRWVDVYRKVSKPLPNLSTIVNYVYALPTGFNATMAEARGDISKFWEKECERNKSASLKTVKAALQVKHNDIEEPMKLIEAILADPSKINTAPEIDKQNDKKKNKNKKKNKKKKAAGKKKARKSKKK